MKDFCTYSYIFSKYFIQISVNHYEHFPIKYILWGWLIKYMHITLYYAGFIGWLFEQVANNCWSKLIVVCLICYIILIYGLKFNICHITNCICEQNITNKYKFRVNINLNKKWHAVCFKMICFYSSEHINIYNFGHFQTNHKLFSQITKVSITCKYDDFTNEKGAKISFRNVLGEAFSFFLGCWIGL